MGIVRASDEVFEAFEAMTEDQQSALQDVADSSCTTGYDNDGSTGYEIFENGFRLGQSAGDRDVLLLEGDGSAMFFLKTNEELLALIAETVAENPSEDGDGESSEDEGDDA